MSSEKCPACNGTGTRAVSAWLARRESDQLYPCKSCSGTGSIGRPRDLTCSIGTPPVIDKP